MPAARGDVLEASVAEVPVQRRLTDARHEQVGVAVVVVVGHGRAHRVAPTLQACRRSRVLEPETAEVAIEPVVERGVGLGTRGRGVAVGEEEIDPAVAVVVERGQAARHRLDEPLGGRRCVGQDERDAALRLHVVETGNSGTPGWD